MKQKKQRKIKQIIMIIAVAYLIMSLLAEIILYYISISSDYNQTINVVLFCLPASASIIGGLLFFLAFRMGNVNNKLTTAIQRISEGDYSVRIATNGKEGFNDVYENFNKMAAELSAVKTLREDYVRNFSHEMKTPLASINGFAKLLMDGDLPPEEQKKIIEIIIKESARLSRMSQNILLLSKVENQQFAGEKRKYRLDLQIKDCVIMLERDWSEKGITIHSDLQPTSYEGDEQLIQQIWVNLLMNAIKFTPRGGEITVSCVKCGEQVIAAVADNGIGMTPEQTARAFDKFYQANEQVGAAGSGIGLTVCRRICQLVGGNISVTSVLGEGSTFTVTLS